MRPNWQTWRVKGVPLNIDKGQLAAILRNAPELRMHSSKETGNVADVDNDGDVGNVQIRTLALDTGSRYQVATVRFHKLPPRLFSIGKNESLPIDAQSFIDIARTKAKRGEAPSQHTVKLTVDQHFYGVTVLVSPPAEEHKVDVLAVTGIGGHAFGSFLHKADGNMWLCDNLPTDMPTARVMTYGYRSRLQDSTSFENLGDLARALSVIISSRLQQEKKRIILIGHSLGGLLIKGALAEMADSDTDSKLLDLVFACLFFGVPNDGMKIESLIPIVHDQPNRPLIESLTSVNSQILDIQKRAFAKISSRKDLDIFCFYETRVSPTATKNPSTGEYEMNGPTDCLVTPSSATSCLPPGTPQDHSRPIGRTHSELVKFSVHDDEYDEMVSTVLTRAHQKCIIGVDLHTTTELESRSEVRSPTAKPTYYIPLSRNKRFVGRQDELARLMKLLFVDQEPRVALFGLGGVGKTQLALKLAYQVKDEKPDHSVFWVPAVSHATFEQAYVEIARMLAVRQSTEEEDIKESVRRHLSSEAAGPWLLVVDNADDLSMFSENPESPERSLSQYLPQSDVGHILFTTRPRDVAFEVADGAIVRLNELDKGEAKNVLEKWLSSERTSLISNDALVEELLEELTYLPLAITQAAAYLSRNELSITEYLGLLRGAVPDMVGLITRHFHDSNRYPNSKNAIATTWLVSFEQIRKQYPTAADLLSFMSCIEPKAIPQSLLPAGESKEQLVDAIGTLLGYAFVSKRDDNALEMHRLVHVATQIWIQNENRTQEIMHKAICNVSQAFPTEEPTNCVLWREYLPHAFRILQRSHGTRLPDRYGLLLQVGVVLYADRRYKEAIGAYTELSHWFKACLPENHPIPLYSDYRLAAAYCRDRQPREAIPILTRVIQIEEKTLAEEDDKLLASYDELALAYINDFQPEQAIPILERIIRIREKTPGQQDFDIQQSQYDLSRAYRDIGRPKEAIPILKSLVQIRDSTLAEEHGGRLAAKHELASAYLEDGRLDEALPMLEYVVKIREKILPKEDTDLLSSQFELARAYLRDNRPTEAIPMFEHVLQIEKATLREEDLSRLGCQFALACAYRQVKRLKEAIPIFEDVVRVERRVLKEGHLQRIDSQHGLARAYLEDQRPKEAIPILEHLFHVETKTLGEEHSDRITSQYLLACAYLDDGRPKEAIPILEHVAQVDQRTLAEEHPDRAAVEGRLARAYELVFADQL